MSRNQSNKREIIRLDEFPRSRTPEPAISKGLVPDSSQSDESDQRSHSLAAGVSASRGASRGRTPAAERSSEEEPVAEGLLTAVE
jgi:hypothetical protein